MPEVAIMVEGQDGIGWPRWLQTPRGPNKDALELWSSLTWLGNNTTRIEFGPLVSPVSFRHPAITAWMASAVDNLAGGEVRQAQRPPGRAPA